MIFNDFKILSCYFFIDYYFLASDLCIVLFLEISNTSELHYFSPVVELVEPVVAAAGAAVVAAAPETVVVDALWVVSDGAAVLVSTRPPTSPTPSVSRSDCSWLMIQLFTRVWFS